MSGVTPTGGERVHRSGPRALRVVADDRTGALETAGAMAARSGVPVQVLARDGGPWWSSTGQLVLDADTRRCSPVEAGARVADLVGAGWPPSVALAHKIDSTLRGNWAAEVVARRSVDGRPALVVPALPELGRTCAGGIVRVDGVPVHLGPAGRDPRSPIVSSSPAELLGAAGAGGVVSLPDPTAVDRWLAEPSGIAVADAVTVEQVELLGAEWRERGAGVLLVGTSSVIGAAVGPGTAAGRTAAVPGPPNRLDRVVVVCGSLHPVAREQVRRVAAGAGVDPSRIDLVVSEGVDGPVPTAAAATAAASLAAAAWARIAASPAGNRVGVVVLGGETTAAFLGDRPVDVVGWAAPGTPWGYVRRSADDAGGPVGTDDAGHTDDGQTAGNCGDLGGLVVATRSGGFGTPDALTELLPDLLARP
jgi:4-hydroxythreonine-4-phosphate dehydrogenase